MPSEYYPVMSQMKRGEVRPSEASARIVHLDDPNEKSRACEQLRFLDRMPKSALFCILSNWIYFAYRFMCILSAKNAGVLGRETISAWVFLAIEMGNASMY